MLSRSQITTGARRKNVSNRAASSRDHVKQRKSDGYENNVGPVQRVAGKLNWQLEQHSQFSLISRSRRERRMYEIVM